jgi:hypothetical protein
LIFRNPSNKIAPRRLRRLYALLPKNLNPYGRVCRRHVRTLSRRSLPVQQTRTESTAIRELREKEEKSSQFRSAPIDKGGH